MAERYPDTVVQFGAWFPDDAACLDYLAWLRWGDAGFGCHLCGSVGRGWPRRDGVSWDCGSCASRTSATAGTIFHHTRTPLTVWFRAGWELTTRANGVSARGIQRTLGLGSYQTAWTMLHRYRRAMVMPGRAKLSGVVEVDDMFIGGRNKPGMAGRSRRPHKTPVLVMAEVRSRGIGRCRAVVMPKLDGASLRSALRANIELGSVVRSDGLVVLGQSMDGFVHERKSVQGSGTPAHILFPAVSRVQAQIKTLAGRNTAGRRRARAPAGVPQRVRVSGSTGARPASPGCCSTDYLNRPCTPHRPATTTSQSAAPAPARLRRSRRPVRADCRKAWPSPTQGDLGVPSPAEITVTTWRGHSAERVESTGRSDG